MEMRRPDRTGTRGLKVAVGRGDLIEDIHRQQRRRVFKRAAQFTTLGVALLMVGWGFKMFADERQRTRALDKAREQFVGGTAADVRSAADVLEHSLQRDPDHERTEAVRALVRAHLWLEFGIEEAEAREAVQAVDAETAPGILARAVAAFAEGDIEQAAASLKDVPETDDAFIEQERAWLEAMVAAARAEQDPEAVEAALKRLDAVQQEHPRTVALRRARALLELLAGHRDEALAELEQARELAPSHLGLAADEALYNALLHRELGGVASVAEQLLSMQTQDLSPRDRAHAELARAVAHVRSGEPDKAVALLEPAFAGLARWNIQGRVLAIQTALEAGAAELVEGWLPESGLPQTEQDIYGAWVTLLKGDVMKALEQLAELPQEDPWVGYLQALALVEQGRFSEARPWIERTQKLLPDRHELEVAKARVELRLDDPKVALRQLQALAEEEPYAPRAWTALGEAHLQRPEPERDLSAAKKALQKAIEREPAPAEAMLLLARVWDARRLQTPGAEQKALDLLRQAADVNPHLPRYKEELAVYLADMDRPEALELMNELAEVRGVTAPTILRYVRLAIRENAEVDFDTLFERAEELGADPRELKRERARLALERGEKEDVAKAQTDLLALLEQDDADVESRVLYAMTHLKQFDRKAAEAAITRGFSTTPDEAQGRLHFALATIQARTGRWTKAGPRARRAWSEMLREDRPVYELLDVAELATRSWIRQNKDRVALSIARELTDRVSTHARAWTIRAGTELLAGDAASARASAERALELEPSSPRAHAILGDALLRFGYKDRAAEEYNKAIELAAGSDDEKEYRDKLRRL